MKTISTFAIGLIFLVLSINVYAADKVVVVPLRQNDPNLVSTNIRNGVNISGVTGTFKCNINDLGGTESDCKGFCVITYGNHGSDLQIGCEAGCEKYELSLSYNGTCVTE